MSETKTEDKNKTALATATKPVDALSLEIPAEAKASMDDALPALIWKLNETTQLMGAQLGDVALHVLTGKHGVEISFRAYRHKENEQPSRPW